MKFFIYFLLSPLLFADVFPFETIEKAHQAYEKGAFQKSVQLFKSLNKDDPSVAYNQANAEYKAGMYDEALQSYAKAKGIDEATRHYNIGNTYFRKNSLEKAIEHYEKALELRDDEDTRYNLTLTQKKKEQQDPSNQNDKNENPKKSNQQQPNKESAEKTKQSKDKQDSQKTKQSHKQKEKADNTMSEDEQLRKKELSHLLKQLSQQKMPTMMYQTNEEKERRMRRILGSLLLVLLSHFNVMAGSVEAYVDSEEVVRGESLLLTISVTGEKSESLPEINEIAGVMVDNMQRDSGYNFVQVNGENKMERTQTMSLEFKPTHSMTIPSFQLEVDGVVKTTAPIAIKVVDFTSATQSKNENFILENKVDKTKVYLGEPILAKVYFKERKGIDIMQLEYEKPAFKAFFNAQLQDEKTYKKGLYLVHELQYLLVAKKEGNLTIEPAYARVATRTRQRQAGGWFADVPKWHKIASTVLNIEVIKPQMAYDLVGDFSLKEKIDKTRAKANKPIQLTIEMKGEGSLEDFDGLSFDIDGVTIYSDDANISSEVVKNQVQSRYLKRFVFIADHDFVIPSQTLHLFNPTREVLQTLHTNTYAITIDSDAFSTQNRGKDQDAVLHSSIEKKAGFNVYWQWMLAFVLGSLMTLLLQHFYIYYKRKWSRKKLGFDGYEALRVLYPNISKNSEVEEVVRKLYAIKNGQKGIKIDRELLKRMVHQYKEKQ